FDPDRIDNKMTTVRRRAGALLPILFWGGVWGLAEAVLGHALHLLRIPGLAGGLMFPVGFWAMRRAFLGDGRAVVLVGVPAVAAAVKLADFLLPVSDPFLVLNPAAAILLEGAAVALLLGRMGRRTPSLASLAAASTAWRFAYFGWAAASASLAGATSVFALDGFSPWRYFAAEPLAAALLILAAFRVSDRRAARGPRPAAARLSDRIASRPGYAAASAVLAVLVEILLGRA
ncbi:MAG: hypothetical protein JW742_05690, partial [Candidatus Aminicenantes bacterium]|nr:hypothetical protein [Candidatus Aminicenantes bacterium]